MNKGRIKVLHNNLCAHVHVSISKISIIWTSFIRCLEIRKDITMHTQRV